MFVGIYKSITDQQGYKIPLVIVLEMIKSGRWKDLIEDYRKEKNPLVKETLPAFTVGGVYWPTKAKENLVEQSGVMELDLDDFKGDFNGLVDELICIYGTSLLSVFRSAGGNGLSILLTIKSYQSEDQYKRIYNAAYQKGRNLLEKVGKFDWLPNSNRLRFVSYDPDLYLSGLEAVEDFCEELDLPVEFDVVEKGVSNKITFDAGLSDDEKFDLVLPKYIDSVGHFGQNGKPRHDWVLGLARWCCRADIDENWLVEKILSEYHNAQRAGVWGKEVRRCVRDSYRSYSVERGDYVPTKKFSYDDILGATNAEEVRTQVLLCIADKINYGEYLSEQGKSDTFVQKEIKFLKKVLNYI